MRIIPSIYLAIFTLFQFTSAARKPESVLLSNVKSLTLRKDLKTSHNRVPAVPQVCYAPTPSLRNEPLLPQKSPNIKNKS